jgi:hypothetical protein
MTDYYRNGCITVLYLETDWSYLDFLHAASTRLSLAPTARRAFNADGTHHFHVMFDVCLFLP